MSDHYALTDDERGSLHDRLASWFGDDRQSFLVSHLAPAVERIAAARVAEAERHKDALFQRGERWKARTDRAEQYAAAVSDSNRDNCDRAERAEAKVARVEALADEWEGIASRCEQRWPDAPPCGPCIERREHARALRAALGDGSDRR